MCVANLHVSTLSCSHRWYTLVRACSTTSNLSNCPQRLKLEGWETRTPDCPWCADASLPMMPPLDDSTHKLFGGNVSRSSSSTTRQTRRDSSATNSSGSLSRSSSRSSDDEDEIDVSRADRNRTMNRRLNIYLSTTPNKILKREEGGICEEPGSILSPDSDGFDSDGLRRASSALGKKWRKSVRLSKGIFK
ncbi:hypothetical protein H2203_000029 [Taxawa tesnikishii (nom. ined.)]|nr:hypothetical protein H2203_000029 [Dothideales sp. JES 119]